jgi:pimeloyl-ACP methyl ester carboxylesterase
LPNVVVEIFENCGHVPQIEFAAQTNEKILGFIA